MSILNRAVIPLARSPAFTPCLRSGLRATPVRSYATEPGAGGSSGSGGTRWLGFPPWVWLVIGGAAIVETSGYGLIYKQRQKSGASAAPASASSSASPPEAALIKDQWQAFTLNKIEPYNHNTKIYHFDFPADSKDKVTGIQVAGALLVKSPDGEAEIKDEKGKPVVRPYTPISPPNQAGNLTLMIKEYKGGKLTPYIAGLEPGKGTMLFKGPIQKYKYSPNTFDRGLCIAGGSGITPMWQLISYSLSLPEDKTKWTLVFSNVSEKDILLRKEWDTLAKQYTDRLEVKYVLDKGEKNWQGPTGFVTADLIPKLFPYKNDQSKVMAFVCGPPPQVNSICGPKDGPKQGELKGALKDLGWTSEEVFKF